MSIWETYFFPQFRSKSYWRKVFFRVFACILFSSYPCFSFYLGCLFGLPSAISCRNPHIEYGRTSYICQYHDCLEFGNLWVFFDVKCSQKLVSLGYHGKPISFHNSDPKVIDDCFFQVSAGILFSSSPCFSFSLGFFFGLPSVISCRNPYIEYGWASFMSQSATGGAL